MKKISVYTRDGYDGSSSYYRVLQYTTNMEEFRIQDRITSPKWLTKLMYKATNLKFGIGVKLLYYLIIYITNCFYFMKDLIVKPDCIIVLRSIAPKTFIPPLTFLYRKLMHSVLVVWDYDDNILESNEISKAEFKILEECSSCIFVTNDELATLIKDKYRGKVSVLHTTDGDFSEISIIEINNARLKLYDKKIKLVWVGSASNLQYLESILPVLDHTAKKLKSEYKKELELICVCNVPINRNCEFLGIKNILWTRKAAIKAIIESHIGIMPLDNTKFTKGKGGFKIVQYMATSLPSVASNVGFNKEVIKDGVSGFLVDDSINKDSWSKFIILLAKDKNLWQKMSNAALERWKDKFNYCDNYQIWVSTILKLVEVNND